MSLRSLSRAQRLLLLALAAGDLLVFCVLGGAVVFSLRATAPAAPAVASLPTGPSTGPPAASSSAVASPTPTATALPLPPVTPTPQATNTRVVSREFYNQDLVDRIVEDVVAIRGLEPTVEIPFSLMSREQMEGEMLALYGMEALRADLDRQWMLYQALGLVDEGAALSDAEVEASAVSFAGLYVPERGRIYVVTDRANMSAEEETVFAHEYTHALQDQFFDLGAYLQDVSTTDADLAARALVEGDATVVMAIYAYGSTTQAEWDYIAYQASFAEEPELEIEGISDRASEIVAFPYEQGVVFVLDLILSWGDWSGVNQSFAEPPTSSEQVLHPEKYRGRRDVPQEVTLPQTWDDGWQLVLADTLGEFVLSVHLDEFLDDPEGAAAAAAGWDGDRIGIWQDAGGRRLALWQTVWDSAAEAAEFEEAYRALIPSRYEGASPAGGTWWEAGDVSVGLARQGDRVWVVWGPDRTSCQMALEASR